MASPVDISNLALTHIGDPGNIASIDPPEASTQARYCARLYPIARDELLEVYPWRFSTRRAALTSLTLPATVVGEWTFAYALPAGCLRPFAVYVPGTTKAGETESYTVEAIDVNGTQAIFANVEGAFVRYAVRVIDTTRYPPSFVQALSYLLATKLASPITRNGDIIGAMDQMARLTTETAKTLDASSQSAEKWGDETAPFWLDAR